LLGEGPFLHLVFVVLEYYIPRYTFMRGESYKSSVADQVGGDSCGRREKGVRKADVARPYLSPYEILEVLTYFCLICSHLAAVQKQK